MLYNLLKVLHIISATFLLMSLGYTYQLWKKTQSPQDAQATQQIQIQTKLFIFPLALIQLVSGFYMLSLNHEDMSQPWVHVSVIGFFIVVICWFTFIYFLMLSAQAKQTCQSNEGQAKAIITRETTLLKTKLTLYHQIQFLMFCLIGITLSIMIFFMANKITSS